MREKITAADLFCGAGGATEGLIAALKEMGIDVRTEVDLIAINHWQAAIDTHKQNHPWAKHYLNSLEQVDPRKACPSERLKILVAGPECTNHARARGGRPIHDQSRASAWLILKWLQELYVENVIIENVPEFMEWGPLGADRRPLKSKKGETFRKFIETVGSLGYRVEHRILCAADYGDATTRERLFIIARRGKKKIVWPEPSHAKDAGPDMFLKRSPWRPAREIIDWSKPGTSIFTRKENGKKMLEDSTLRRIEAGLCRFLPMDLAATFIVTLRRHLRPRAIDEPLPTIAASGLHMALVQAKPFIIGQQSGATPRSIDLPLPSVASKGAIAFIVPQFGERAGQMPRTHDLENPLPAVTSHGAGALVQPAFLIDANHGRDKDRSSSLDDPLKTLTSKNGKALVQSFIVGAGGPHAKERSVGEPLRTILPKDGQGLVQPFIVGCEYKSANGKQVRAVDEPLQTMTTNPRFGLTTPYIVEYYGDPRHYHQSVEEPLKTVTAKARFGLVDPKATVYGLDILFRMLYAYELAAAHSFPKTYVFMGGVTKATRMIGNSWPIEMAKALCKSVLSA
jgi:DNA (cytosine-5)-methyltransferase 1